MIVVRVSKVQKLVIEPMHVKRENQ